MMMTPHGLDPSNVPERVLYIVRTIKDAGYQAFLVGGYVRDTLLGLECDDFDVATDALPEQTEALFPNTKPVGSAFGTILVVHEGEPVHVTTFRTDLNYIDGRRPEGVVFGDRIETDLSRRDLTINAMAWDPVDGLFVDPFEGKRDLEEEVIRAVGDPVARFKEDALRMLRTVRFAARLHFRIDQDTWDAMSVCAKGVLVLSGERIRDEMFQLFAGPAPAEALWMLNEAGLLLYIFPELKSAERMIQHKQGAPTLLDHLIQTAAACPPDPVLRLAGLLHDIGKLTTRSVTFTGRVTFHGHPEAGAVVAEEVAKRWRMSRKDTFRLISLVRMHMAPHGGVQKKTIKKWVARFGESFVEDLLVLAAADSVASGWPSEPPEIEPMRRFLAEVISDKEAVSLKDLAIDGNDVMQALNIPPGPEVGQVLEALLEEVLNDSKLNEREALLKLAKEKLR